MEFYRIFWSGFNVVLSICYQLICATLVPLSREVGEYAIDLKMSKYVHININAIILASLKSTICR